MDTRFKEAVVGALHQRGRVLCAGDNPRTAPIIGEPVFSIPAPDGWADGGDTVFLVDPPQHDCDMLPTAFALLSWRVAAEEDAWRHWELQVLFWSDLPWSTRRAWGDAGLFRSFPMMDWGGNPDDPLALRSPGGNLPEAQQRRSRWHAA